MTLIMGVCESRTSRAERSEWMFYMADIEDIQYKLLRELSERYQCTIDDLLNEAVYEYYEDERREMIRQEAMKHKDESQTDCAWK